MTGPFTVDHGSIVLRLARPESDILREVAHLLDAGDDADGRLSYSAHPDDPEADRRYQELVADSLDILRREDRSGFDTVASGAVATAEEVEAFMRVVGEARIVLAARLGIDHDGWEADLEATSDPELALLAWLGYLQDAAVGVLSESL
jgi:hypothetical protein